MKELDAATVALIEDAMGPERELVAARLARGCRCFFIEDGGRVAAYGWLSKGPEWIGELDLEIVPGPGEGYVWNCVTLPAFRRRGMFRSLLLGISAIAAKEGTRRLWIGSVAIPAERAVGPSGYRPALTFASWRFAGLHVARAEPGPDAALAMDATRVLGRGAGWRVHRAVRRRH